MENCCIDEAACCCSALPFVDGDLSMANKVACFTYCQNPPGTDDAQSPLVISFDFTICFELAELPGRVPTADTGGFHRLLLKEPPFIEWHLPPEIQPNPPNLS